jgi:hypothetical protein
MKKSILFLVLGIFVWAVPAKAQFSLGGSAGLNRSNNRVSNVLEIDANSRTGYFLSLFPVYHFKEKISLKPELSYSLEGFESSGDVDLDYRFHYVRFIPELEFTVLKQLGITRGINFGVLLDEQQRIPEGKWNNQIETVSRTDWGLTAGAKYYLNNFFVQFRYYLGMHNISETEFFDDSGNPAGPSNQKNRNIQFGVGYSFARNR